MIQSIVAGVVLILGLAVAGVIRDKLNDYTPPIVLAVVAMALAVTRSFATNSWTIQHAPIWVGLLVFVGVSAVIAIALINRGVTDFNDAFAAGLLTFAVAFPFAAHWWLPTGAVLLLIAWLNRQNEGSRPAVTATISVTRRVSGIAGSFLLLTGTSVNVFGWTGFFLSAMLTLLIVMWKVAKAWYSKLGAVVTAILCGLVFFTSNPLQSLKQTVDNATGGNAGSSSGGAYPKTGVGRDEFSVKDNNGNPVRAQVILPQSSVMTPDQAGDKLGWPFGHDHDLSESLSEFRQNYDGNKAIRDCAAKWLKAPHAGDDHPVTVDSKDLKPMVLLVGPLNVGKVMETAKQAVSDSGVKLSESDILSAPYLVTFGSDGHGGCKPYVDTSNRIAIVWGYHPIGDTVNVKGFDAYTGAPFYTATPGAGIYGAIAQ